MEFSGKGDYMHNILQREIKKEKDRE